MSFKLLAEVDRLDCLLRDIMRLQASHIKASNLGNGIPSIEVHRPNARGVPSLLETVYGHSVLSVGKTTFTSELYAYFEEHRELYARTLNHWYRLDVSGDRRQDA